VQGSVTPKCPGRTKGDAAGRFMMSRQLGFRHDRSAAPFRHRRDISLVLTRFTRVLVVPKEENTSNSVASADNGSAAASSWIAQRSR